MHLYKLLTTSAVLLFILTFITCSENTPTGTNPPQTEQNTLHLLSDLSQVFPINQAGENPISIQLLDINEEPLADVLITIEVTDGEGELLMNNERSQSINLNTDTEGMAEVIWIPGNGIENLLTISVAENEYPAEQLNVGALVQDNGYVVLISFKWHETDEYEFPYTSPPYSIGHDGRLLESNNFLVFSDESTDHIKLHFAALVEDALYRFNTMLEINNDMLGIGDIGTKIKAFTCKSTYLDNPQMFANDNGFLIYGIDSERWNNWSGFINDIYINVAEHELTHVMQFRMGASFNFCDSWFVEGYAEYMSGGVHTPITSSISFNQWRSVPDHTTNPIETKQLSDLSVPPSRAYEYYPAFHLAVKYLLESNDINRSVLDVKNMFLELAETENFAAAFENCFGISVEYFRDNYYQLMTDFLNN